MTKLEAVAAIAGIGSLIIAGLTYFQPVKDPLPVRVIPDAVASEPAPTTSSPSIVLHPTEPQPRADAVTPPPSITPVAPQNPAFVPPEPKAPADNLVDVIFRPGDSSPGLQYVVFGIGETRLGRIQYGPAAPLRVRLPRGSLPIRFQIVGQQTQPFMTYSDSYGNGVIVQGPSAFVVDAFDDGTGRYGINIKRDTDPR